MEIQFGQGAEQFDKALGALAFGSAEVAVAVGVDGIHAVDKFAPFADQVYQQFCDEDRDVVAFLLRVGEDVLVEVFAESEGPLQL